MSPSQYTPPALDAPDPWALAVARDLVAERLRADASLAADIDLATERFVAAVREVVALARIPGGPAKAAALRRFRNHAAAVAVVSFPEVN